ncbi:hypothetical protein LJC60_04415 [Ruminococcaceae bacterium OttesenSCG-928-D13]|nr:hypothetical protein [Ruminococcaceae bacterium OttesenSCG-928-D13]
MRENREEKRTIGMGLWVLSMVCVAVVCFALFGGVAYSGIRQAQLSAATASLGQIESTLLLAERYAEDNGYGAAPRAYDNVLRSYDDSSYTGLTPQEKFVLDTMLDSFGQSRNFDFAITRVEDSSGVQTQIYFFPVKGRTDARRDHHYLLSGGKVLEKNG